MLSIRTQDRMALVPYDSSIIIRENGKNEIAIILNKFKKNPIDIEKEYEYALIYGYYMQGFELGRYATKERALEVLDEIEKKLVDRNVYLKDNGSNYSALGTLPIVYQMPNE